jgi:hypothetical protein
METLTKLSEREKLVLHTRKEVFEEIYEKIQDINYGKIDAEYYLEEIDRELASIDTKLKEPKKVPEKVEVITPDYGPGDEVSHRITDSAMLFTVMEVRYGTQEYKLTSKNQIKPITVIVGWGELDETL